MRHKSTELMGTIKAFVEEYYKNYRHSPSTTEIADAVGIARGTAYKYLVAMSDNGNLNHVVPKSKIRAGIKDIVIEASR